MDEWLQDRKQTADTQRNSPDEPKPTAEYCSLLPRYNRWISRPRGRGAERLRNKLHGTQSFGCTRPACAGRKNKPRQEQAQEAGYGTNPWTKSSLRKRNHLH